MILIKPLSTKAYDRRAPGDCGASGIFFADVKCNYTQKLIILIPFYYNGFPIHELNYAIDKWTLVSPLKFL